jgi:hypothetical protein
MNRDAVLALDTQSSWTDALETIKGLQIAATLAIQTNIVVSIPRMLESPSGIYSGAPRRNENRETRQRRGGPSAILNRQIEKRVTNAYIEFITKPGTHRTNQAGLLTE